MKRVALIDESGIFRMHWHASEQEDVNAARRRTIAQVTSIAAGFDHVAVCVDTPPYKRKEIYPGYKAHREKAPEVLHEEHRKTIEELSRYWHVLGAKGYEADDIIATLTLWACAAGMAVVIYSSDKDLMQLIADDISVISVATGEEYDADKCRKKFGVEPSQVGDLLALIGDKSDGIPGIKGVGVKTAARWLAQYKDLDGIFAHVGELTPNRFRKPVLDQDSDIVTWRKLVDLDAHAPIEPSVMLSSVEATDEETGETADEILSEPEPARAPAQSSSPSRVGPVSPHSVPAAVATHENKPAATVTLDAPDKPASLIDETIERTTFERALEPRDNRQAWGIAKMLFESRCFGDWPNPQAIMAAIMTGRTYGLDAVASVRGMHYIKRSGKIGMSASLMIGLCRRHPDCRYFQLLESSADIAEYETHRRGDPKPVKLQYTIEQANRAGIVRGGSAWDANPEDMLRARASSKLARIVYPDILAGLYCAEEID